MGTIEDNEQLLHHIHEVQQNGSGRDSSFTYIWIACLPSVRSAIFEVGLRGLDAEDAIQETSIALWDSLSTFDANRSAIAAYARIIARHRAIDFIRRNRRRMNKELAFAEEVAIHETAIQSPESCRRDSYSLVEQFIRQNWGKTDISIVKSFASGKSLSAIATMLGLPTPTVKSRWLRFRRSFKKRYGHLFTD
jgi:RNA polymerase sigma factor (sigma-70 family)